MNATSPSLANLKPNPAWASLPLFDRTGWKRMAFGEFAESIGERAEPKDAQEEIYVGLEHLDPQCLHIRRWGKGSDVIGGKLRFRKGDIIFGKRRAYQRKLAVAEFGGICSAHAMVIRARPDKVLPEFLPFLMMSDRFMNRAVEISVGSLSPTINWTTLKLETFDLPPLDQQRRIAEILWAVDEALQKANALQTSVEAARSAKVEEHFHRSLENKLNIQPLEAVAKVSYGITLGAYRKALPIERPYLRVANLQRNAFDLSEIKTINCEENEVARFELADGDVLIVEGHATVTEIGRAAVWRSGERGMLHQNHLIRARCSEDLIPESLNLCINAGVGQDYFRSRAKSSSGLNTINSTVVKEFSVPKTPVRAQEKLVAETDQFDGSLRAVASNQVSLRNLVAQILNTICS
ncbi:MAG: restriction endonuclease subunit S [Prosthecobacter sp.]